MGNWDKISLYKFQQIEAINRKENLNQVEKACFFACTLFDMTEYQFDEMFLTNAKKCLRLLDKTTAIFSTPFKPKPRTRIGKYFITYDPSAICLGQYIELSFFLQDSIMNAHSVIASLSHSLWRKNNASDHRKKAEYFLKRPATEIIGGVALFNERLRAFHAEYSGLFGLDQEVHGDAQGDKFNRRYGWIYSASQVAEYERITLDEAYALPIRQALNDLSYLKAKGIYETEQLKKANNGR